MLSEVCARCRTAACGGAPGPQKGQLNVSELRFQFSGMQVSIINGSVGLRFCRVCRGPECCIAAHTQTTQSLIIMNEFPSFRPSRLPFSPSDISTVASGHLHRQDSHLLERQLASLHERTGFETPRPLTCLPLAA